MSMDVLEQAGLVARELHRGERDGAPTKVVVARRAYAAAQADVWDALTQAERLPRWFAPVTGDLREGGRYQVEGNAGGTIERCDAPRAFALTWEMGGQTSWVDVRLVATSDDATELELRHEAHVDPQFWEQFGPGAVGVGWDLSLLGLAMYLASGAAVPPDEAATWPATPEGRGFVGASVTGWVAAATADGQAGDDAAAAGERTRAFYTGDAPPEA